MIPISDADRRKIAQVRKSYEYRMSLSDAEFERLSRIIDIIDAEPTRRANLNMLDIQRKHRIHESQRRYRMRRAMATRKAETA